jgi:hypothetical protein
VPTRSATASTASVAPGYFLLVIAQASGQAGKSGQFAAFIQQRIRHGYRIWTRRCAPSKRADDKSATEGPPVHPDWPT